MLRIRSGHGRFGYLRLCTSSCVRSIMPRTTSGAWNMRGLSPQGSRPGRLPLRDVHHTRFGDIATPIDDLQPLVSAMFMDAGAGVRLSLPPWLATFDVARWRSAREGWSRSRACGYLTRDHHIPFRRAPPRHTVGRAATSDGTCRCSAAAEISLSYRQAVNSPNNRPDPSPRTSSTSSPLGRPPPFRRRRAARITKRCID